MKYILESNTLLPAPIVTPPVTPEASRLTLTDAWIMFALLAFFDVCLWVAR